MFGFLRKLVGADAPAGPPSDEHDERGTSSMTLSLVPLLEGSEKYGELLNLPELTAWAEGETTPASAALLESSAGAKPAVPAAPPTSEAMAAVGASVPSGGQEAAAPASSAAASALGAPVAPAGADRKIVGQEDGAAPASSEAASASAAPIALHGATRQLGAAAAPMALSGADRKLGAAATPPEAAGTVRPSAPVCLLGGRLTPLEHAALVSGVERLLAAYADVQAHKAHCDAAHLSGCVRALLGSSFPTTLEAAEAEKHGLLSAGDAKTQGTKRGAPLLSEKAAENGLAAACGRLAELAAVARNLIRLAGSKVRAGDHVWYRRDLHEAFFPIKITAAEYLAGKSVVATTHPSGLPRGRQVDVIWDLGEHTLCMLPFFCPLAPSARNRGWNEATVARAVSCALVNPLTRGLTLFAAPPH
jgi:hypothetical protein